MQLFLPISTFSQIVLSLTPENHQCSSLPVSFKWQEVFRRAPRTRTFPGVCLISLNQTENISAIILEKNDWVAFTKTIKRLLKWWDIFQSTQRSVDVTWFSFVPLSPITTNSQDSHDFLGPRFFSYKANIFWSQNESHDPTATYSLPSSIRYQNGIGEVLFGRVIPSWYTSPEKMEKSELSRNVPSDEKRNMKPENRGHAGPTLTSTLLKTAQGQTVSAWSQPKPSIGLLFYYSKYVPKTDGFWIRISPKCPHTGWLYRRCPQTPKASRVWKELRNNGQRTQSAFAYMSGGFRATAGGASSSPLPKRP